MDEYFTLREKVMNLLMESDQPLTVDEILGLLGLEYRYRRLVYEALIHIAKTVRRKTRGGYELVMTPPVCMRCGYVFRDLKKPRKPSKCPHCKSERIKPPAFKITARKK